MIQGEVVDHRGRPIPDARVMVLSGPGPLPDIAQLTDSEGRFALGSSRAGRYELAVHADGHAPATAVVELPDPRAGTVQVRLAALTDPG
jgi:Carboxypeptidase regulatory-like domain